MVGSSVAPRVTGAPAKDTIRNGAVATSAQKQGFVYSRKKTRRAQKKVGLSTKLSKREEGIGPKETAFRARLEAVYLSRQ